MLNILKNNFIKLGLLGFLSLYLTGCATPIGYRYKTKTIEDVWGYDEKKVTTKEEEKRSILSYEINNIKSDGNSLDFLVTESKKEISDITTKTIIPIYTEEQRVRQECEVYLTIVGPSNEFCRDLEVVSTNRTKVRDHVKEEKKTNEIFIFRNQPARDALVKVNSQYFGFGEQKSNSFLTRTDTNGIAKSQITKTPYLWYFKEDDAVPNVAEIIKKGMKKELFDKINFGSIHSRNKSKEYPLEIRTMSEANILMASEDKLKIIDDKKTFYVNGTEIDMSPLYSYIENIIKAELESRYMPRSVVVQVVGEDLMPLEAAIELNAVKTLHLEELLDATEKIKNNYLVKSEELYEHVNVDPSNLLYNLDGQKLYVPAEGLEVLVNVPSEYEIKVIKEGYVPAEGRRNFTRTMKGRLPVKMYRLGTSVTIGTGKSSIDVE